MNKLDAEFQKARAKYLRFIRLRQDCKNVNGCRWQEMNDKLIEAEENYHRVGTKVKVRDAKRLAKKQAKEKPVTEQKKQVSTAKTAKKPVNKSPSARSSKKDSTTTQESSGYVVVGDNTGKSIWDL